MLWAGGEGRAGWGEWRLGPYDVKPQAYPVPGLLPGDAVGGTSCAAYPQDQHSAGAPQWEVFGCCSEGAVFFWARGRSEPSR